MLPWTHDSLTNIYNPGGYVWTLHRVNGLFVLIKHCEEYSRWIAKGIW
jgi:hypothetical protein